MVFLNLSLGNFAKIQKKNYNYNWKHQKILKIIKTSKSSTKKIKNKVFKKYQKKIWKIHKKNQRIQKMSKIVKKLQKSWKVFRNLEKSGFFLLLKILIFLLKKNTIVLVLPIKEISLWPELSSPHCFRIQGEGGTLSVTKQEQEQEQDKIPSS